MAAPPSLSVAELKIPHPTIIREKLAKTESSRQTLLTQVPTMKPIINKSTSIAKPTVSIAIPSITKPVAPSIAKPVAPTIVKPVAPTIPKPDIPSIPKPAAPPGHLNEISKQMLLGRKTAIAKAPQVTLPIAKAPQASLQITDLTELSFNPLDDFELPGESVLIVLAFSIDDATGLYADDTPSVLEILLPGDARLEEFDTFVDADALPGDLLHLDDGEPPICLLYLTGRNGDWNEVVNSLSLIKKHYETAKKFIIVHYGTIDVLDKFVALAGEAGFTKDTLARLTVVDI